MMTRVYCATRQKRQKNKKICANTLHMLLYIEGVLLVSSRRHLRTFVQGDCLHKWLKFNQNRKRHFQENRRFVFGGPCERPQFFSLLSLFWNKKFWEELIPYFLWYDTGHIENDASNNSSIVACVFVTAVKFLLSRYLATIGGFLPSRCLATIGRFLPSRCLATIRGIHRHTHRVNILLWNKLHPTANWTFLQ
jgi:hypothetical protein